MPLLNLKVSKDVEKKDELLKELSKIVAECIGKPESYVMVFLEKANFCMASEIGDSAFCDVKSIGGLSASVNKEISKKVCELLQERLNIETNRVYLNFTNIKASEWGYNGSTFG